MWKSLKWYLVQLECDLKVHSLNHLIHCSQLTNAGKDICYVLLSFVFITSTMTRISFSHELGLWVCMCLYHTYVYPGTYTCLIQWMAEYTIIFTYCSQREAFTALLPHGLFSTILFHLHSPYFSSLCLLILTILGSLDWEFLKVEPIACSFFYTEGTGSGSL